MSAAKHTHKKTAKLIIATTQNLFLLMTAMKKKKNTYIFKVVCYIS